MKEKKPLFCSDDNMLRDPAIQRICNSVNANLIQNRDLVLVSKEIDYKKLYEKYKDTFYEYLKQFQTSDVDLNNLPYFGPHRRLIELRQTLRCDQEKPSQASLDRFIRPAGVKSLCEGIGVPMRIMKSKGQVNIHGNMRTIDIITVFFNCEKCGMEFSEKYYPEEIFFLIKEKLLPYEFLYDVLEICCSNAKCNGHGKLKEFNISNKQFKSVFQCEKCGKIFQKSISLKTFIPIVRCRLMNVQWILNYSRNWLPEFKQKYDVDINWQNCLREVNKNRYDKNYLPETFINHFKELTLRNYIEKYSNNVRLNLKRYCHLYPEYKDFLRENKYTSFELKRPRGKKLIKVELFNITMDEIRFPKKKIIISAHSALHSAGLILFLLDALKEHKDEMLVLYDYTQIIHPGDREYVLYMIEKLQLPLVILSLSQNTSASLIKNGLPKTATGGRYCTRIWKVEPSEIFYQMAFPPIKNRKRYEYEVLGHTFDAPVQMVGIAAYQSPARAQKSSEPHLWEKANRKNNFLIYELYPVFDKTFEDLKEIVRHSGLEQNPYDLEYEKLNEAYRLKKKEVRLGCTICMYKGPDYYIYLRDEAPDRYYYCMLIRLIASARNIIKEGREYFYWDEAHTPKKHPEWRELMFANSYPSSQYLEQEKRNLSAVKLNPSIWIYHRTYSKYLPLIKKYGLIAKKAELERHGIKSGNKVLNFISQFIPDYGNSTFFFKEFEDITNIEDNDIILRVRADKISCLCFEANYEVAGVIFDYLMGYAPYFARDELASFYLESYHPLNSAKNDYITEVIVKCDIPPYIIEYYDLAKKTWHPLISFTRGISKGAFPLIKSLKQKYIDNIVDDRLVKNNFRTFNFKNKKTIPNLCNSINLPILQRDQVIFQSFPLEIKSLKNKLITNKIAAIQLFEKELKEEFNNYTSILRVKNKKAIIDYLRTAKTLRAVQIAVNKFLDSFNLIKSRIYSFISPYDRINLDFSTFYLGYSSDDYYIEGLEIFLNSIAKRKGFKIDYSKSKAAKKVAKSSGELAILRSIKTKKLYFYLNPIVFCYVYLILFSDNIRPQQKNELIEYLFNRKNTHEILHYTTTGWSVYYDKGTGIDILSEIINILLEFYFITANLDLYKKKLKKLNKKQEYYQKINLPKQKMQKINYHFK